MRVLELFSCAGGMAEGFRRAGLPVTMAFDWDPDARASYAANLGHVPIGMDARDLERLLRAGWSPGPVDIFLADPPCVPWSRAGKRRGTEDERDMLLVTVEIVRLMRPRLALIANVPGLDDAPNWPTVQATIGSLVSAGYCIDFTRTDAADYGGVYLCQEHAEFAGRLSIPTHVMGCATNTVSSRASPDQGAPSADRHSKSLPKAPYVDAVSPSTKASTGVGRSLFTGPEESRPTPKADTRERGQDHARTVGNIGSSPHGFLVETSGKERSSITSTETAPTTPHATSKSTIAVGLTIDVTALEIQLAACGRCRWYATPQHRIRPWWFLHPVGTSCISWPQRTHGSPEECRHPSLPNVRPLRPWMTCRQALGHLSPDELGSPIRLRWRGQNGSRIASTPDEHAMVVGTNSLSNGNVLAPETEATRKADRLRRKRTSRKPRASDPDAPAGVVTSRENQGDGSVLIVTPHHPPSAFDEPSRTVRARSGTTPDKVLARNGKHPPAGLDAPAPTLGAKDRGGQGAQVLDWPWERPATVVQTDAGGRLAPPGHHGKTATGDNRGHGPNAIKLSEKAASLLQGFPNNWSFCGETKKSRWSQIGQAMPAPLAEAVARSIRRWLEANPC